MYVSLLVLDQGGAVFHPVTAVEVFDSIHAFGLGPVDVPADDSLNAVLSSHSHHRLFVVRHELHRGFGLRLEIPRHRPVTEAEPPPRLVQDEVCVKQVLVEHGTHPFQQAVEMHQTIKLMSMNDEIAPSLGREMHGLPDEPDAAETKAEEVFEKLVVIARDVGDACLLAILSKEFLDEKIVVVGPVPSARELPPIDEIADDVEVAALIVAEEFEQPFGLGVFGAQMNVRNPDGAIVHDDRCPPVRGTHGVRRSNAT